jgi:t-SNARE complex subunit (syntaxin)
MIKQPDYSGYESAKQQWIASNPNATPEEYQRAIRKIAARYGV